MPNPKLAPDGEAGIIIERLSDSTYKVHRHDRKRKKRATLNIMQLCLCTSNHDDDPPTGDDEPEQEEEHDKPEEEHKQGESDNEQDTQEEDDKEKGQLNQRSARLARKLSLIHI